MAPRRSGPATAQLTGATSMRPPRFTLRRAMLLVAVVALLFGVYRWGESRRARFRAIRHLHDVEALKARLNEQLGRQNTPPKSAEWLAASEAGYRYHTSMRNKYRKAEKFPWLPV